MSKEKTEKQIAAIGKENDKVLAEAIRIKDIMIKSYSKKKSFDINKGFGANDILYCTNLGRDQVMQKLEQFEFYGIVERLPTIRRSYFFHLEANEQRKRVLDNNMHKIVQEMQLVQAKHVYTAALILHLYPEYVEPVIERKPVEKKIVKIKL